MKSRPGLPAPPPPASPSAGPQRQRKEDEGWCKSGVSAERKAVFFCFLEERCKHQNVWEEEMMGSPRDMEAL